MKHTVLIVGLLALASPAWAGNPVEDTYGLKGASSGVITLKPQAAAGTWNWNFPVTAGSAGQVLASAGGVAAPMTWVTLSTVATSGSATDLGSGTLAAARMPALTGDVTMSVGTTATTLAAGSASNLDSGTLAAARGGAGTITGALKGSGAGVVTQAACADLSNGATGCSTTVGTAATASTGTSGATVPLLNGTNVWSGQQSVTPKSLSISTATFTPDGSSNNYTLTLVHASCPCTLANPSATPVAGTGGQIVVIQSSTGSDTIGTYGSQFEASGGVSTLTLSTAANAVDILSYYVRDATHIEVNLLKGLTH